VEKFILRRVSRSFQSFSLIISAFLIFSFSILTACSPGELETPEGLDSYTPVSGSFNQADNEALDGSGVVRFESGLTSQQQDISLKAELDGLNAGSYVGVVFNSSSNIVPDDNGLFVKFLRQGANVIMTISVNGVSRSVTSPRATYLLPNSLNLVIQFFNYPSARILIWQGDSTVYGIETAIVDTARTGDISSPLPSGIGAGVLAGLHLNYAKVSTARIGNGKIVIP
jgi:hypothetical protein